MMPSRLTSQACSNTIAAGIGAIDHGDAGEPHSEDGAEASEFVSAPSILSRGFKSVVGVSFGLMRVASATLCKNKSF